MIGVMIIFCITEIQPGLTLSSNFAKRSDFQKYFHSNIARCIQCDHIMVCR